MHVNKLLDIAKQCVDYGHRLTCPHFDQPAVLDLAMTGQPSNTTMLKEPPHTEQPLGMATIRDETCMDQPTESPEQYFAVLLTTTDICEGNAKTNLHDRVSFTNHVIRHTL